LLVIHSIKFETKMKKQSTKKVKVLVSVFFFFILFSFSEKVYGARLGELIIGGDGTFQVPAYGTGFEYAVEAFGCTNGGGGSGAAPDPSYYGLNGTHGLIQRTGIVAGSTCTFRVTNSSADYYDTNATTNSDGTYGTPYSNIDTVTPADGSVLATSTTYTVGATGQLVQDDLDSYSELQIDIENSAVSYSQCADVICSQFASNPISLHFRYSLLTASNFNYSSTTGRLPIGKYWVTTKIIKGSVCIFGYCASTQTITATSTTFVISTSTKADAIKGSVKDYISSLSQGGSDFSECGITNFNLLTCGQDLITYAFVPTSDAISYNLQILHDDILTHFPLGYITDLVTILSTSTVGTLVPIDATVPNGVVGAGASIHLDLTHVLDPYLNATTSRFNNSSASSTQTLYEYTEGYWEIFVIVSALLYMLGRILGRNVTMKKHDN